MSRRLPGAQSSRNQFLQLMNNSEVETLAQERMVDFDYYAFVHRLKDATRVPVIRVPPGFDLAGARFIGFRGALEITVGKYLQPATGPLQNTVWRMILQPYVQTNPLIGLYCPVGTGLLGPLQRPYTVGALYIGDGMHNPITSTGDPGDTQWNQAVGPPPEEMPVGAATGPQMTQSATPNADIGKINNTWYLPKHEAVEAGFMGNNNWLTNGYFPDSDVNFLNYLGGEGSWNMEQSDVGGETAALSVSIYSEEVAGYRGQTMEDAGYVVHNGTHPSAWIHAACDNIWNLFRATPDVGGCTNSPNDEFNNWGGQPPLGCATVYPYATAYTLGSYEGGIVQAKITASNGARCLVTYVGQNEIKEYGMHTLNNRHTVDPGTARVGIGAEDISKIQEAYSGADWINQIDYYFEPTLVKAGSLSKVANYQTLTSTQDNNAEMYVALPFIQPKAGLCVLHPPYLAWTLSEIGKTGNNYPGVRDYQHSGWETDGMNCSSHWQILMGWNGTSCGNAPWMGSVGGYPAWSLEVMESGGIPPGGSYDTYISQMDLAAPQFPASTYPSNATITLPYNDAQNPGYQGWNSVSQLLAFGSSDGNGSIGPGFGMRGSGAYSFRSFPMYVPGGDQRQPFVIPGSNAGYSKYFKNPLGGGAPFQQLMQQFISVVDGKRITRAPNSVAQSLYACMPQLEVVRLDQAGAGAIEIQLSGQFYYNLLTPNKSPLWQQASPARIVESPRVTEVRKYAASCAGAGASRDQAMVDMAMKSQKRAQEAAYAETRNGHSFLGRLGEMFLGYGESLVSALNPISQVVESFQNAGDLASRLTGGTGTLGGTRGMASAYLASQVRR